MPLQVIFLQHGKLLFADEAGAIAPELNKTIIHLPLLLELSVLIIYLSFGFRQGHFDRSTKDDASLSHVNQSVISHIDTCELAT